VEKQTAVYHLPYSNKSLFKNFKSCSFPARGEGMGLPSHISPYPLRHHAAIAGSRVRRTRRHSTIIATTAHRSRWKLPIMLVCRWYVMGLGRSG
jgi:hypothetical protein